MTATEVMRQLAAVGAAAADALDRGDEDALAAALEERDRLQRVAEPILAALHHADVPGAELVEVRELALAVHLRDSVLAHDLAARRDAVSAELRRTEGRAGALAAYAAPASGGARLRAVG